MDAKSSFTPEIILHNWQANTDVDVYKICEFLQNTFGAICTVLGSNSGVIRAGYGGPTESCRITDIKRPFNKARAGQTMSSNMPPMYDGHEILRAAFGIVGTGASLHKILHIIITDMLICTYDDNDARYHARPVVASNISLVSTSAMIWGPARSRQYYVDIMECAQTQGNENDIELDYASHHLTCNDSRMQQVSEGYVMQAVFYAITHEAFCADRNCRLYNAHRQSEMLSSQMNAKMCSNHQAILDGLI